MNRKIAAGFEVVLMMVSFFAFGYFAGFSEVGFVSDTNQRSVFIILVSFSSSFTR